MRYGLFFWVIFGLLTANSLRAQVLLDTMNGEYHKVLLRYYEGHTAITDDFLQSYPQKRIRKPLHRILKYEKENFANEVKQGKYLLHPVYSPLVDSLFDQILKSNLQLSGKSYKVLLTSEPHHQAYSTVNGIIAVDISLLPVFENKYQLGFTLAHELAHQFLFHSYRSIANYIEKRDSDAFEKEMDKIEKQEFSRGNKFYDFVRRVAYDKASFRRKKEQQADSLGFLFYRKAFPGHEAESLQTLRLLKEIDQEKDSLSSQELIKRFEVGGLVSREAWLQNDIGHYKYKKAQSFFDEDSMQTHLDADLRIKYLKEHFKIDGNSEYKAKNYSESIRNAAKEYILILHFGKYYGESLYRTLIALKEEEPDAFLKQILYANLQKLKEARNHYELNKYVPNPGPDFSPSYNRYLSLIRNLSKAEFDQLLKFYQL